MSTIIGNLRVTLGLDSASFQNGLSRTQGDFQKFGKRMATIGAGIATAGVAAFAAFNNSTNRMADLQKQAQVAGMSAQEFKIAALAAEEYGVSQEKLSDILKDVNDKIGDFAATGGGEMKDFFENIAPKVGLTLKSFEGLSSSDALKLYVTALEDANVSQAEMTFYLEALANDATALVPVFGKSGAAIDDMAKRAAELGLSIDQGMIAKSREAQRDLQIVSEVLRTQFDQAVLQVGPSLSKLAAAFSPVISGIAGLIEAVVEWTDAWGKKSRQFVDNLIGNLQELPASAGGVILAMVTATSEAASGWAQQALGWGRGVVASIVEGLAGLYQAGIDALKELARGMRESVAGLIEDAKSWGGDIVAGLTAGIRERAASVRDTIKGLAGNVKGWFTDDLEIQSPSRVFMRFGEYITQGLSNGIDIGAGDVSASIKRVADGVIGVLEDAAFRGGSIIDGIRQMAGSMLGSAASGLFKEGMGDLFGMMKIPGFATGVPHFRGGLATLHERGGELAIMPSGSTVIPHELSKRMVDGAGGEASALAITVTMDESTGSLGAFVRNQAGEVVASAAPQIVGQSVGATRRSMNKSKAGWGL